MPCPQCGAPITIATHSAKGLHTMAEMREPNLDTLRYFGRCENGHVTRYPPETTGGVSFEPQDVTVWYPCKRPPEATFGENEIRFGSLERPEPR